MLWHCIHVIGMVAKGFVQSFDTVLSDVVSDKIRKLLQCVLGFGLIFS